MEKIFKGNNLWKYIGLSVSLVFCACFGNAAKTSCPTAGATQDKYTASGCSYTTQTRTCCSDKYWTDFGGTCKDCSTVPSGYTKSGSYYKQNITNGYCLYTGTCNSYDGWSFTKNSCNCNSGYTMCSGTSYCQQQYQNSTYTLTDVYHGISSSNCEHTCKTGIGSYFNAASLLNLRCDNFPSSGVDTSVCDICSGKTGGYTCLVSSSHRHEPSASDGICYCSYVLKNCTTTPQSDNTYHHY